MEMQGIKSAARPESQSNLAQALDELIAGVDRLQDNLDHHHKRIEPLLNDFPIPGEASMPDTSEDRAPYSTIVRALGDQIERINNLADRLNMLTYRLDV